MRMPARMPHRYAARSTLHLPIPAHVHTCQVYALGARDAPPSAASYNFGCCLGIPWGALLRGLGSDGPPCNPAQAVLSSPSGPALLVAASSNFQSVAEWVVDRRLARVPLTITCIRSKPDNQMHTLTPTHTHTYTRTWAHGHTRAHTHTHTHTHTRARVHTRTLAPLTPQEALHGGRGLRGCDPSYEEDGQWRVDASCRRPHQPPCGPRLCCSHG